MDAGWLLIDAHERLSLAAARKVFGHEIAAWSDYAESTIERLKSHEGGKALDDERQSAPNRMRFRRTMDFALPGDRVFDIGFGRGHLAAQVILNRGVVRYHGIDIVDRWAGEAYELLAANGLADADIKLEAGDLYDLTQEQVAATDANLLICCEVLEHVPDAELALKRLADALPEGADLLFTVPLHGRLEHVWGHVSVFDVARLKGMLEGAGLYAHHVEPLANTWSVVVASKDPGPSARVRAAGRRPAVNASAPLVRERHFVDIAPDEFGVARRKEATTTVGWNAGGHPEVSLTGNGGVRFAVRGLESLRLAWDFVDCADVERFDIKALAKSKVVASWRYRPSERWPAVGNRRIWLRPGEASVGFEASPYGRMLTVDAVEVTARLVSGGSARFGLRAAYLP